MANLFLAGLWRNLVARQAPGPSEEDTCMLGFKSLQPHQEFHLMVACMADMEPVVIGCGHEVKELKTIADRIISA